MKRSIVLGVLVVAGGLSLVFAAQQAEAPKNIEVTKLKDNLFVLKGGGGNTAVFVMADGVTVVDAKNPGWGQPILTKIKERLRGLVPPENIVAGAASPRPLTVRMQNPDGSMETRLESPPSQKPLDAPRRRARAR